MTIDTISIYDASNIDKCHWPEGEEGEQARRYIEPLVRLGVKHFVDNIDTSYAVLIAFGKAIPLTINHAEYDNSFICSPYGHYVAYSFFWAEHLENRLYKYAILPFLKLYGKVMRAGQINKVVIVNNWLFTTNPTPELSQEELKRITQFLQERCPEHAIVFRSITTDMCPEFCEALKSNAYQMIASRYMWLTKGDDEAVFKTRIFKSDLKFISQKAFEVINEEGLKETDADKMQELYRALYIQKYSTLNPQFNAQFMKHLISSSLLKLQAIRDGESLEGVVGYHQKNDKMISPLFGYNPQNENKGTYRYLSTLLMLAAQKHQALFNQSAGGGFYKKTRRAYGCMEYTAVYHSHLTVKRRLPWQALAYMLNTFGSKAMKNY